MNRKKKRDPRRKAPVKSEHSLRYVDKNGKIAYKTTTYVTPEMRATLKPAKETW